MSVRKVKETEQTSDGRKWIFEVRFKDLSGETKSHKSKKYLTRHEAIEAERLYVTMLDSNSVDKSMTMRDLYLAHFEYQRDKVKVTTLRNYLKRRQHLEVLSKVKVVDFNINHFEMWKRELNNNNLSTIYKNDLYKYLKSVLNYGQKWYNFNFNNIYNKMVNFNNPNEHKKEMLFFTYDEFKKFISVENDLLFKCIFETFYFCGLRSGELRGLKWIDVDLKEHSLSIKRNIVINLDGTKWLETTPKTKSSYRTIPLNKVLLEDLKLLYEEVSNIDQFNDMWFVFGSFEPIGKSRVTNRKNNNCKLAGVKQIRIHDFRHSCASLLIDKGANITLVARYLGHTKIDETLNIYSHMFKNTLDDIVEAIDNL